MTDTDQEKTAIITQYKQSISAQTLGLEHSISKRTIYRWAKVSCVINPEEKRTFTAKEYNLLLQQVARLENIVDILKMANRTVHAPLNEKLHEFQF